MYSVLANEIMDRPEDFGMCQHMKKITAFGLSIFGKDRK
jgi:hypothetical protein